MILVTGASGTIGRELVKALSASGVSFRAGYRDFAKAPKLTGLEPALLDFDAKDTLEKAMQGVDKLFILASGPKQGEQETRLADVASHAGVGHIVKLSVLDAESEGYTFAKWHRAIERHIETLRVPYTFLRPTGFMQNFLGDAANIKTKSSLFVPVKDGDTAYIDVRDIADVAAEVLTASGTQFHGKGLNLTGPESLSREVVTQKLTKIAGKPVHLVEVPPAAFVETLCGHGVPRPVAEGIVDLYQHYARDKGSVSPEVARITGKRGRTLDAFLDENAAAFSRLITRPHEQRRKDGLLAGEDVVERRLMTSGRAA